MNKGLKNDFKMIFRGVKEIGKISPTFLSLSCLYALFQSGQPFISIYFSARIIDGIIKQSSLNELFILVGGMVGLECIFTILMKWMDGITSCESRRIDRKIQLKLAEKLFRVDYEMVENTDFQKKKEKIETIDRTMGMGLPFICRVIPQFLKHTCTIALSIALTCKLFLNFGIQDGGWKSLVCSPIFSLLLLLLILFSIYANMKIVSKSVEKEYEMVDDVETMDSMINYYLNDYIGNYHTGKDIRIYRQKSMLVKELSTEYYKYGKCYQSLATMRIRYGVLGSGISVLVSAMIYLFVGLKALAGVFGVGSIVQYVGSINQFVSGVTKFVEAFADLRENNEAVGYYFDYMDVEEKMMDDGISLKEEVKEIEFRNVSFKYPGTEEYAIRNLSLKLQKGRKVAIVGMNGSGKTTLIKLLCRLYRPTTGVITLNGIDIQEYKYDEYVKLLSVVFQDFKLFSYTIGENVSARIDGVKDIVEEVLVKAGFGERYQTLEKGSDTYLYKDYDENGVEISGGEAQKIAIARALYKDAPIVILDEPTAALDPISEWEIYSQFNQMVENKMAIFISHRLSSCRFCDEIVVMDSGKLIQLGNHDSLVNDKNGKYYELWSAQAQYYKEEDIDEKGI